MTRTQLTIGMAGLCLLLGSYAGCYFQREVVNFDNDRDGFDEVADCDDDNPSVYPGAAEICGDGLDNDCDGKTDSLDPECGGNNTGGAGGEAGGSGGVGGDGGFGGDGGDPGVGGNCGDGGSGGDGGNCGDGGMGGDPAVGGGGSGGIGGIGGAGGAGG